MENQDIATIIEGAQLFHAPPDKPCIPLYHWRELEALPSREYLIKGLIDKGATSVVYGASNSGKTFTVIDMGIHIALGWDWCGKKTKQGCVVYIAAEGGMGIRERLKAFQIHYALDYEPDVYIIPSTVPLSGDDAMHMELIERISKIDDIQLIIIDTLARSIAGGDENSSKDMSEFIRHCDIIRENTKAHILIVHHSGKDDSKGARGSSALKAAIDTEIHVTQTGGIISAIVEKQREGKTGVSFYFQLKEYEVRTDEDGEAVYSCALEIVEGQKPQDILKGQSAQALQALYDLMIDKGLSHIPKKGMQAQKVVRMDDFKEHFLMAGIASSDKPDSVNKAFHRAKETLKTKGYIGEWDGYIWILDRQDKSGQTGNLIIST